ncbi:MAG: phage holin family protein [Flavobacteriales bacterium]|jgi:putative membrane protein|nr:phage holin family protein [Flavobacteriales bacterium]
MKFLLKILANLLAVLLGAWMLPGIHVESNTKALVVAIVLALLNTFLRPILIFLTIPATIVTLGLFLLVINASIIMLTDYFIDGFLVDNFWWALLFSFILAIVNALVTKSEQSRN